MGSKLVNMGIKTGKNLKEIKEKMKKVAKAHNEDHYTSSAEEVSEDRVKLWDDKVSKEDAYDFIYEKDYSSGILTGVTLDEKTEDGEIQVYIAAWIRR